MRRKPGLLLPLEESILEVCIQMRARGIEASHGFLIAKALQEIRDARLLTAYGTLYRALDRMERAGLLASSWEDPQTAADDGRPRRRLYRLTLAGEQAFAKALSARPHQPPSLRQREANA